MLLEWLKGMRMTFEVNIFDKSDITAALIELKEILKEFEYQIPHGTDNNKIVKRK